MSTDVRVLALTAHVVELDDEQLENEAGWYCRGEIHLDGERIFSGPPGPRNQVLQTVVELFVARLADVLSP